VTISPTDLQYDIDELSESCHQRDEEIALVDYYEEMRNHVADVQGTVVKLEKQLQEQWLRSRMLEAKLQEALLDEESLEFGS
jgi:hypothetical protein